MSIWPNQRSAIPASRAILNHAPANRDSLSQQRVPMRQSEPIEVDGVFLGAAVEHELGVRFIAVDVRVTDMNQSVWPTLEYARLSARQLFRSRQFSD
ncbi:MAG: hypothetical protein WDN25_30320 [Acetobacteraceae bacterium]